MSTGWATTCDSSESTHSTRIARRIDLGKPMQGFNCLHPSLSSAVIECRVGPDRFSECRGTADIRLLVSDLSNQDPKS